MLKIALKNNRVSLDNELYKKIFLWHSPHANKWILKTKIKFANFFISSFSNNEWELSINTTWWKYSLLEDFMIEEFKMNTSEVNSFLQDLIKMKILKKSWKMLILQSEQRDVELLKEDFDLILDILFYKSIKINQSKTVSEKTWEKYSKSEYIFLWKLYWLKEIEFQDSKRLHRKIRELEASWLKASTTSITLNDNTEINVLYFRWIRDKIKVIYSTKTLKEVLEEADEELDLISFDNKDLKELESWFSRQLLKKEDYQESLVLLDEWYYDQNIRSIYIDRLDQVKDVIDNWFNQFKLNVDWISFIVLSLENSQEKIKELVNFKLKFSKDSLYKKFPLKKISIIDTEWDQDELFDFFFRKNAIVFWDDWMHLLINNDWEDSKLSLENMNWLKENIWNKEIISWLWVEYYDLDWRTLIYSWKKEDFLENSFKKYDNLDSDEENIEENSDEENIEEDWIEDVVWIFEEKIEEERPDTKKEDQEEKEDIFAFEEEKTKVKNDIADKKDKSAKDLLDDF